MTFYSKKDTIHTLLVFGTVLLIVAVVVGSFFAYSNMSFSIMIQNAILIVLLIMVIWMWFGCRSVITDDTLIVYLGFLKLSMPISEIILVEQTKNMYASAALSMRRLHVRSNRSSVYISPKNEDVFLEELTKRNKKIKVIKK